MKESIIQTQIINALQYHENLGELMYERTNAGAVRIGKRRIQLARKGSSDIKVYLNGGITLHLEVKCAKGRQNFNQIEWQKKLEYLDHKYHVVRSISDVEQLLKKYLETEKIGGTND